MSHSMLLFLGITIVTCPSLYCMFSNRELLINTVRVLFVCHIYSYVCTDTCTHNFTSAVEKEKEDKFTSSPR